MMAARFLLYTCLLAPVAGKKKQGFAVTFENHGDVVRELYWLKPGGDPKLMGKIEPVDEVSMKVWAGHSFGWRAETDAEECQSEDLEGTVTVAEGMERYVLGTEPVLKAIEEEERESEQNDLPFTATFRNDSPRTMRLHDTTFDANYTVERGAAIKLNVKRGWLYDWTDAETGELLYRSVIEFLGQSMHAYVEEDTHAYSVTCSDVTPPSPPLRSDTYVDARDGRGIVYDVLSEDPFIAYLHNWTVGNECAEMEAQARSRGLTKAIVSGERTVIADRRAISANLYWSKRNDSSVNNRLIDRAFEFARATRHYELTTGPHQEPLNFIQYAHAGEYRPHCDGQCEPRPYRRGGRVATLIHYCKAAERGGATIFPKLRLKVAPDSNSALLFAYKRDDGYMDDGNTLHAGCLVREGYKQIVTMWMREGVTPEEPWSNFR